MTDTTFSIVYDGEPVAEGTIDARDLAPALLAFADLVDEAAPLIDPNLPRISVRVRPDFQKGSFEVYLELANLYAKFVSLFSGPDAQAWSSFFQIVGLAGVAGVFQLVKRSKGRKPTKVTIERKETVTITFEGDDPITVDNRVWQLFQNIRARKAIEKIMSPLIERGFSLFKIRHAGKETLTVSDNEAGYFVAPSEHEGETTSETDARVVIVSPSFNSGNKWRVYDGARTLYVAIRDEAFERSVQVGEEAFRKGDTLHVTLQTTQWVEDGKLRAEYSIVELFQCLADRLGKDVGKAFGTYDSGSNKAGVQGEPGRNFRKNWRAHLD